MLPWWLGTTPHPPYDKSHVHLDCLHSHPDPAALTLAIALLPKMQEPRCMLGMPIKQRE